MRKEQKTIIVNTYYENCVECGTEYKVDKPNKKFVCPLCLERILQERDKRQSKFLIGAKITDVELGYSFFNLAIDKIHVETENGENLTLIIGVDMSMEGRDHPYITVRQKT